MIIKHHPPSRQVVFFEIHYLCNTSSDFARRCLTQPPVSLWLGHASALTATGSHSLPSRRFATLRGRQDSVAKRLKYIVGATLGNPQSSLHSLRGTPILVARRSVVQFRATNGRPYDVNKIYKIANRVCAGADGGSKPPPYNKTSQSFLNPKGVPKGENV